MKNPWLKKNPAMSMWLSAANSVAGSVRGKASAQAKRHANKMIADSNAQIIDFWTGKAARSPKAKKKPR
jgi:hypothetical protein